MEARRRSRGRSRLRLAAISIGVALALPILPATVAAVGDFLPYQAYPVGSTAEAVAIGDVTGDGRNDVVMTTSYDFDPANDFRLWVFAATEYGTLAAPVSYATAATYTDRATSVAVGDLTGDGRADVALGVAGLGVQLFPQEASGLLGSPTLTATIDSDRIRLGHLDGDAFLDVAGIGWGSDTVTVMFNDGAGGLGTSAVYPAQHAGYDDLEIGDVTDDGLDDLVVMSGQSYADPNITVLAQLTDGGFGFFGEFRVGTDINTHGIGVGDANNDGLNDVVASYGGNVPTSYIGEFQQFEGTLFGPISFTTHDIPAAVDLIDLDLDGGDDVVVVHDGWAKVGIYLHQPGGSLDYEDLYPIPYGSSNPHGLAVGDVNGDGLPDIVVADAHGGLVVLRQNSVPPPATVPGPPTLDSATAGNGSVSLAWRAPAYDGGAEISDYNIYRRTSSGGSAWLATVGPSTAFTDTTAVNGTTYYYQVSAVNRVGEGPRSAERSATPATVPGAPTLVSATGGNGSATLIWNAPVSNGGSAVTGYTATASPGGATCSVTGLGCTIGGLTSGTSYSFTVRATNAIGTGAPSNALSATPGQPPSAPRSLTAATNKPHGVILKWSAPSTNGGSVVTGYRIHRATSSGAEVFLVSVGSTATSYVDNAAAKGIRYYYWVTAVNAFGVGPASNEASAVAK